MVKNYFVINFSKINPGIENLKKKFKKKIANNVQKN